ncbi:hypothetical protein [Deinococcus altitudinis]|uniref:hypothetical protein n=1 Tax=Deinococcus altitudinis TaxID=468914 RepID=UPI003892A33E
MDRDTDTTLLTRYVLTPPAQVRDLSVSGSDFQETHLTLRFSTPAPVRFPAGKNLHAQPAAQARLFARSSPCAADLKAESSVRLWRVPKAATSIGRLVVKNGQRFCVFVWNTDF